MEKRVKKEFIYEGFGFPIILVNVPMIKTRNQWTPDIDYNLLENNLVMHLAKKSSCLTGNEIKFLRKFFKKSLDAFGLEFGVSHVAVMKWEKEKNSVANINPATEKCIRMFILDALRVGDKQFRDSYHEVIINKLAKQQKARNELAHCIPPTLDVKNLQVA